MRDGFLSMGHGGVNRVEESEKQLEIYEKIIARSLSVRETELLSRKPKKVNPLRLQKPLTLFYDDAVRN